MAKLFRMTLMILAILSVCGCASKSQYVKKDVEVFDVNLEQAILVDKETGVQYILLEPGTRLQTITVRLSADGKPMVDKEWKLKNKK